MNANKVSNADQYHFGYILKCFHTKVEVALEA